MLGNDVEDSTVITPPPKEILKKSTSSKKVDAPPPSADPSKAKNNRTKPTGNEAAFRDKQAGRYQNRSKETPVPVKTKETKTFDRRSRSGKTDSAKKVKQAWGDNEKQLIDEEAAAADVEEEEANNNVSLEAYMNEQSKFRLNRALAPKKVEEFDDAELFVKKQDVFVEATKVKTLKSKTIKPKKFLEFDVSDSFPPPSRGQDSKRGGKTGAKRDSNKSQKQPVNANFPALV